MSQKYFINWSLWIGFWSGVYVYIYLLTPLAPFNIIWMTFVALPIYFNGGAKPEEFFNYFLSLIFGIAWGLFYLWSINGLIALSWEAKFATAMVVFVVTVIVCALHFLLPALMRLNVIPIMFGGISMMFSQGGTNVVPVFCTLAGGLLLGLVCGLGTKFLNPDGSWTLPKKAEAEIS